MLRRSKIALIGERVAKDAGATAAAVHPGREMIATARDQPSQRKDLSKGTC